MRTYAAEHNLPLPRPSQPSLLEAKRQILACSAALLPLEPRVDEQNAETAPRPSAVSTTPAPNAPERIAASVESPLHDVVSKTRPLVIVGGLAKLEKLQLFPEDLRAYVEWIETTRQGTHAIGNLANRIRHHRVSALILLDGLVGHRHTDPLVSAARDAGIVAVYAGKGGQAALSRALGQVEKMLGQQSSAR